VEVSCALASRRSSCVTYSIAAASHARKEFSACVPPSQQQRGESLQTAELRYGGTEVYIVDVCHLCSLSVSSLAAACGATGCVRDGAAAATTRREAAALPAGAAAADCIASPVRCRLSARCAPSASPSGGAAAAGAAPRERLLPSAAVRCCLRRLCALVRPGSIANGAAESKPRLNAGQRRRAVAAAWCGQGVTFSLQPPAHRARLGAA